mmetsp:Transcript_18879/g.38291  ORF Transcript_18879/g.38291 Transcript_18879/m.38291 type:complete len:386 (-) Transcript_18879:497-1654(-)
MRGVTSPLHTHIPQPALHTPFPHRLPSSLPQLPHLLHQQVHHPRIRQRRRVPQRLRLSARDLPQDPPHDLAAPRHRQARRRTDDVRSRERPDGRPHRVPELPHQFLRLVEPDRQGRVAADPLSLDLVGKTHHGRLGHGRMGHEGRFHLGRTDPVSRDVQDVVHPTRDPDVTVLVPLAPVPREVVTGVRLHVDGQVPLVIAQACTRDARPRLLDGQDALDAVPLEFLPGLGIEHHGVDAVEGEGAGAGFHGSDAGEVGDDVSPGFGLPVGVDDGAAGFANDFVVPPPSLRIDRLPHRPQYPQTAKIVLVRRLISEPHQTPNRRRRRVKHADPVPLDHVPIPSAVGVHRGALEHEGTAPVQQRPVNDVRVSRDPPRVRDAGVHVGPP